MSSHARVLTASHSNRSHGLEPALDIAALGAFLLDQHAALRAQGSRCEALALEVLSGRPVARQFAVEISRLRQALLDHNAAEARLLAPLLATLDARGPRRVDAMLATHVAEHAVFLRELDGTMGEVAVRFARLCEELDLHMKAEERTFLSARVLDDLARALGR